jgi:hypothetical protein
MKVTEIGFIVSIVPTSDARMGRVLDDLTAQLDECGLIISGETSGASKLELFVTADRPGGASERQRLVIYSWLLGERRIASFGIGELHQRVLEARAGIEPTYGDLQSPA